MCCECQTWKLTAKNKSKMGSNRDEMFEDNTKCNEKRQNQKWHFQCQGWSNTSIALHPEARSQMVWLCSTTTTRQCASENIHAKSGRKQMEGAPMQEVERSSNWNLQYPILLSKLFSHVRNSYVPSTLKGTWGRRQDKTRQPAISADIKTSTIICVRNK